MKPRGLRNKNPLNIRHGVSRWQGRISEQSDPDFVIFRSMAMGYRAAWKLMESYRFRLLDEGKAYNLVNIIHRWAPPSDGNDTSAYIRTILTMVNNLGGHEGLPAPSTPQGAPLIARILAAMTCVENGIKYKEVPRQDIIDGFHLAFPKADIPIVKW
ncbi:MAG: hypothetical protein IJ494_04630 [Bacteroides sp.]|nr:hypothetical protein [Bacteroides sp.]